MHIIFLSINLRLIFTLLFFSVSSHLITTFSTTLWIYISLCVRSLSWTHWATFFVSLLSLLVVFSSLVNVMSQNQWTSSLQTRGCESHIMTKTTAFSVSHWRLCGYLHHPPLLNSFSSFLHPVTVCCSNNFTSLTGANKTSPAWSHSLCCVTINPYPT